MGEAARDPNRPSHPWEPHERIPLAELADHWHQPLARVERWIFREHRIPCIRLTAKSAVVIAQDVYDYEEACRVAAEPRTAGTGKPKSAEHRRRISEALKASHARRRGAKS